MLGGREFLFLLPMFTFVQYDHAGFDFVVFYVYSFSIFTGLMTWEFSWLTSFVVLAVCVAFYSCYCFCCY